MYETPGASLCYFVESCHMILFMVCVDLRVFTVGALPDKAVLAGHMALFDYT